MFRLLSGYKIEQEILDICEWSNKPNWTNKHYLEGIRHITITIYTLLIKQISTCNTTFLIFKRT